MNTQSEQLKRVKSKIAPAILEFCRQHLLAQFHMADLVRFVALACPAAPDSASRILRDLRASGEVEYTVLSRKDSLYFVAKVAHGS